MFHLIGLAARARSGKDTVANYLLRHADISSYALADPVKMACQALFGLTDAETWADEHKEHIIPLWDCSPRQFFQLVGTEWMRAQRPDHWIRRAEQILSSPAPTPTASMSALDMAMLAIYGMPPEQEHSDYWQLDAKQARAHLEQLCSSRFPDYQERRAQRPVWPSYYSYPDSKQADCIVIRDIRYENEADFIRSAGGQIWHIQRKDLQAVNPHSSEWGIAVQSGDAIIHNNGTLAELEACVAQQWQAYRRLHPKS